MCYLHPILRLFLWSFALKQTSTNLKYDELEKIDANCYSLDSCNVRRFSDSLDKYTCQCASYCSELDTCCIDATFRNRKKDGQSQTCQPVNGEHEAHYFMVDNCLPNNEDERLEKLCKMDSNNEDKLLPLVPVTSLSSNVTYKNYFCFRCNEATDDFLYWNVLLNSNISEDNSEPVTMKEKDASRQTWMAPIGKNGDYLPVEVFLGIPGKIQKVPHMCIKNAISNCSGQWKIIDVKEKCSKYTSYIYIIKNGINVSYKNPHCALCNFESLEKMGCGFTSNTRTDTKRPFSFTLLLDINRSDGDIVGKVRRCDSKSTWDPGFKKCRSYSCALPWFVVKNGKCGPP